MGSGERKQATEALNKQADIAEKQSKLSDTLEAEADPLRKIASTYWTDVTKGGGSLARIVQPQISLVDQQYKTALDQIKERTPAGGQMDRAIRDWRLAKTGTRAGIYAGGVRDAVSNLGNLGLNLTSNAAGNYSNTAQTLGQVASTFGNMAQGKQSSMMGAGEAGGMITASAIIA